MITDDDLCRRLSSARWLNGFLSRWQSILGYILTFVESPSGPMVKCNPMLPDDGAKMCKACLTMCDAMPHLNIATD